MTPELEAKIAELAREIPDEELAGTGHNVSLYFDCKYDDPCADLRELLIDFARRAVEFALAEQEQETLRKIAFAQDVAQESVRMAHDRAEAAEKESSLRAAVLGTILDACTDEKVLQGTSDPIAVSNAIVTAFSDISARMVLAERLLAERTPKWVDGFEGERLVALGWRTVDQRGEGTGAIYLMCPPSAAPEEES